MDAARVRGRKGGRPAGSYNKVSVAAATNLYQKDIQVAEILKPLHISRAAL